MSKLTNYNNREIKIKVSKKKHDKLIETLSTMIDAFVKYRQIDKYYNITNDKYLLKMRLYKNEKRKQLILYKRQYGEINISDIKIYEDLDPKIVDMLDTILSVAVVVSKTRHFFKMKKTRIHLDDVDTLGYFLELEYCGEEEDCGGEDGQKEISEICKMLDIETHKRIRKSYAKLILDD